MFEKKDDNSPLKTFRIKLTFVIKFYFLKSIQIFILLFRISSSLGSRRFGSQISMNEMVFGVYETSQMLNNLSIAFPEARIINISKPVSSLESTDKTQKLRLSDAIHNVQLFASLLKSHAIFVYVGPTGFLLSKNLTRRIESKILKWHCKIVVYIAVGSDVRSVIKTLELASNRGEDNLATLLSRSVSPTSLRKNERIYRIRARVMDRTGTAIFSLKFDQLSYISSETQPFLYFFPRNKMHYLPTKFDSLGNIRILHAPSNPQMKGSEYVSQALASLRNLGHQFEYEIISNQSNEEVLRKMASSHIFINEFYSYGLGMASIEAMANTCVLITRCDPLVEKDYGDSAVGAWLPCEKENLERLLKTIFDDLDSLKAVAIRGFEWVSKYQSQESCSAKFLYILKSKGVHFKN